MKPEIASLKERMSQGGDWQAFRLEIAALHAKATREDEYVTLLEAHRILVVLGKSVYDQETYSKLLPITASEYRMLLNKEATEDGIINPVLLERITRREVEAGRLDPSDGLRTSAASGALVVGDSAEITAHRCKHGDWFFYGVLTSSVLSVVLDRFPLSALWLIPAGLLFGWFLNDREHKRIKAAVAARRNHGRN